MKKRIASLLTAVALLAANTLSGGLPSIFSTDNISITAQAADTVIYNGDTMSEFAQRTAQSVSEKYAQALTAGSTYENGKPETYYSVQPSLTNPYHQGVLSTDTLARMQGLVDFYRWLAGCKPLTVKSTPNETLQYQTLDRNFEFGSFISDSSKPADMPQTLWDKGSGCSFSLLISGPSPQEVILGFVNEGYYPSSQYWSGVSHRSTLLDTRLSGVQFGYCGKVTAVQCNYDYSATSDKPFYAFPSPGYVPIDCIRPYSSAWSVSLDTAKVKITDTSKVTITVTNTATGKSYQCTDANSKAKVYTNSLSFVQPTDYDTTTNKYTSSYKVTITGLTDSATSKPAQIQYTVKFIDHKQYAAGDITHAGFEFSNVVYYKPVWSDAASLAKLGAALPQEITITNVFGAQAKIQTDGSWKYDEAKSCWYNSAVNAQLPELFTDSKGVLKRIEINAIGKDTEFYKYNEISVTPQSTTCGSTVQFYVQLTILYYDRSILCQLAKDASGEYYCKKTYEKKLNDLQHYYDIDVTAEDSGEYISFYFRTGSSYDTAYASNGSAPLTVAHKYSSKVISQPSCTGKGKVQYTCACGHSYTDEAQPTGHDWQINSSDWVKNGETYDCTVTAVCKNDSSHTLTETATAAYSVTKQPTCTEKGVGTFTATFKDPDLKPKTKTVEIAATNHSWCEWQTSGFDVKKGTRLLSRTCGKCGGKETKPVKNEVTRLAGSNRYSTAAVISNSSFDSVKTVILASGGDFADALAGVPLAINQNAPILLTTPNKLSPDALAEIKRLGAEKVIILGGDGAISTDVEKTLTAEGLTTERLAGTTRFGTATAIAQSLCENPTDVLFVYAFNYADALSVSTAAALRNAPIIYLRTSGALDADTQAYLAKLKEKGCVKNAYVIGGEGVISNAMLSTAAEALSVAPTRLAGSNRYETCTAVNNAFKAELDGSMICIATGCDFPDALAGGVYAALNRAPLFLENSKQKTLKLSQPQSDYLKAKKPLKISIFGGEGAVPDSHAQVIADNCV